MKSSISAVSQGILSTFNGVFKMCCVLWMSLGRVFIVIAGSAWLPVPASADFHHMASDRADRRCAAPCVPLVAPMDALCYAQKVSAQNC